MNGFPLEILTMLGSTLLSGMLSLKKAKDEAFIAALAQQQKGQQEARSVTNRTFQITRRWIALMSVFSVIVLPKLVAIFDPDILVTVGYTEFNPGFLFLTEDRDVVVWREVSGLVITPLDTHVIAGIIGLYFGTKVGR